jgi:Bacterial protein of unknown function (DUF899)
MIAGLAGTDLTMPHTPMENLPQVASREEWLAARKELLARAKELTRHRDEADLTALGRQEAWEEPEGRAAPLGLQVGGPSTRLPDEYGDARR